MRESTKQDPHLFRSSRMRSGSILVICATIGFIVLIIGLWCLDIFWLHLLSGKEMSAAEKVAMAGAIALNKNDNIGQMNYMLAHARELVFCARCNEATAEARQSSHLELARALSQRTHENTRALANARRTLQKKRIGEAFEAVDAALKSAGSPNSAQMASVATSGVSIDFEKSCFGCLRKEAGGSTNPKASVDASMVSSSNVKPSRFTALNNDGGKDVEEYDKNFVDQSSKLYKGNCLLGVNPPMGGDDTDLDINIASLPPCINNYVSPPRLVQPSEFQYMASLGPEAQSTYMPTAVYVVLQLEVTDKKSGATNKLMAPGIAVTGGAGAPPTSD